MSNNEYRSVSGGTKDRRVVAVDVIRSGGLAEIVATLDRDGEKVRLFEGREDRIPELLDNGVGHLVGLTALDALMAVDASTVDNRHHDEK